MDDTTLKARYLVANFVGLAMIGSVFICAVVVEVMQRSLAPFAGFAGLTPAQAQLLKYVFVGLGLGHFFLLKFIPKILAPRSVQGLFQAAIVTLALCEAVAIFGLVLFFLTGKAYDFYLFFALSLFYFYLFYPKYTHWEQVRRANSPEPTP